MLSLFAYGTLQLPHIQKEELGRVIKGTADTLPDYELSSFEVNGQRYTAVAAANKRGASVPGHILQLTEEELKRADVYEPLYKRARVTLASGTEAWVYVAADKRK